MRGSHAEKLLITPTKVLTAVDWNLAPACIGSLPHPRPEDAVDLVLEKVGRIPFWPQLPRIDFGENMYAQYAAHLPGIQIDMERRRVTVDLKRYDPEEFYTHVLSDDLDRFAYPKEHFRGFHEFMSREIPKDAMAVKGQLTGPISMGLQIVDTDGKSVLYDDAYAEIVRKNLNMMARWQERELRSKHDRILLFLDEPYLSLMGTPFASISSSNAVAWINEVLEGLDGLTGAHCCGNTDWPTVMSTNADVLSFDAYEYGYTISLYPEEVADFLEKGGSLAWGIVPNTAEACRQESVDSLVSRLREGITSLERKGIDADLLIRRSMITPQCGLGGVEVEESEAMLDLLVALSDRVRGEYGFED